MSVCRTVIRIVAATKPRCVALVMVAALPAVAITWNPCWAQPKGGHPLAGRHGGLAELLEQEDWPEDGAEPVIPVQRPRATPMPAESTPQTPTVPVVQPNDHDVVVEGLRQAIQDRRATLVGTRLFERLAEIEAEERDLGDMLRMLQQCDVALTAAKRFLAQVQTQAAGSGPAAAMAAAQLANASTVVGAAQARFTDQARIVDTQRRKMQPLYRDAINAINKWMGHYRAMRRAVGQDRRDVHGKAVVYALEQAAAAEDDFHEGRILLALAHAYHGEPEKATAHLREAQADNALGKYLSILRATDVGFDRALAWVLLGQPAEVVKDMQEWDARYLNDKSARHLWLLGLWYATKGQDQEAERRVDRCLRAAGFYDKGKPPISSVYLGDGATFYFCTSNAKLLRPDRARKMLERVPEGDRRWQVLRAQAADLAERGDWKEAGAMLRECEQGCPLTLVDEVRSQLAAYEKEQVWTRPPPAKKKPAA